MLDVNRYWDVHEMCKEYARTAEMAKNEVRDFFYIYKLSIASDQFDGMD